MKVPAVNGRKSASAATAQIDLPVTHHAEVFEGAYVGV